MHVCLPIQSGVSELRNSDSVQCALLKLLRSCERMPSEKLHELLINSQKSCKFNSF